MYNMTEMQVTARNMSECQHLIRTAAFYRQPKCLQGQR